MESPFVDRTATDTIRLAGGLEVQVRQRLNAAEEADLNRQLVQYEYDAESGSFSLRPGDFFVRKLHILRAYIVAWTFKDGVGNPVPYAPSLVDSLDGDVVNEIAQAIDRLQKERREALRKKAGSSSPKR